MRSISTIRRRSSLDTQRKASARRAIRSRSSIRRRGRPSYDQVCSWATKTGVRASVASTAPQTLEPNLCACSTSIGRSRRTRSSGAHDHTDSRDPRRRPRTSTPAARRASRAAAPAGSRASASDQRLMQSRLSNRRPSSRIATSRANRSPPPAIPRPSTSVATRSRPGRSSVKAQAPRRAESDRHAADERSRRTVGETLSRKRRRSSRR